MGKYFSTESELYAHFKPFFEKVLRQTEAGEKLKEKKISFRFLTKDPSAEIALDARKGEGVVQTGAGNGDEDIHITLRADLLHQLLLGRIRLMAAIMGRQITAKGLMGQQRELSGLIATLGNSYKEYLNENQKQEMID